MPREGEHDGKWQGLFAEWNGIILFRGIALALMVLEVNPAADPRSKDTIGAKLRG